MTYFISLEGTGIYVNVTKEIFESFRIGDYIRFHGLNERPYSWMGSFQKLPDPNLDHPLIIDWNLVKFEWWAHSRTFFNGEVWVLYFINYKN